MEAVGFRTTALLFSVPVVHLDPAEKFPRSSETPFVGIGIIPVFHEWIVGDEEEEKIGFAGIRDLVRFARRMENYIAGRDHERVLFRTDARLAFQNEKQL